jgi:hypothetical protein
MSLNEIKTAVEAGQTVHWANVAYVVVKDRLDQFLIVCKSNNSCVGLTWQDGVTVNGTPEQFFIA